MIDLLKTLDNIEEKQNLTELYKDCYEWTTNNETCHAKEKLLFLAVMSVAQEIRLLRTTLDRKLSKEKINKEELEKILNIMNKKGPAVTIKEYK